ncbi:MAG: helix-turn-helix transcriptional regulator [Candidatus Methanomethylophilaceae archaeon]|nr:helix-turn-helix transcriptional regulator [Candidatus Methanomethylophilaceae archaeon]MBR6870286.1 helix-turn-helix transcriptional regulator [Candidatus Methanomethylophilaceae archaeon]
MEIKIGNDFEVKPFDGGYEYHMRSGQGRADVFCHIFDGGFVVNLMTTDMRFLSNQNRVGDMNYVMIDTTVAGRMSISDGIRSMSLVPGSSIVYRPTSTRAYMSVFTGCYESITIGVDMSRFDFPDGNDGAKAMGLLADDSHPPAPLRLSSRSMADVLAIRRSASVGHEESLVAALIDDVILGIQSAPKRLDIASGVGVRGEEDVLYERIISDLSRPADIASICMEEGIDRCSICSRFKSVYGDTPYSFHKRLRLQSAAADLVLGAEPVGEVALGAGYRKEGKFAAEFKRELGCRPKHFRKEVLHRQDGRRPRRQLQHRRRF